MAPKIYKKAIPILAAFVSILVFKNLKIMSTSESNSLSFWVSSNKPSSTDPVLFDFFKHHPIQSLVNCTLTSLYRGSGVASAELAASWTEEGGGTIWKFNLRNDVKFSDGELVTPELVKKSFIRIFYLLKKQNTNYVFVKRIKGFSELNSPSSDISGIKVVGQSLVFSFEEPIEKLSEAISFGHFAVVHPKAYDHLTGEWLFKNPEESIGCGPYKIAGYLGEKLIFEKRSDYPADLSAKNGFLKIVQVFQVPDFSLVDLMVGGPDEKSKINNSHRFISSGGRAILYLRVIPWRSTDSVWANKSFRVYIRNSYYELLRDRKIDFSKSFFPLVLNGVSEPQESSNENTSVNRVKPGTELRVNHPYAEGYKGPYTPIYAAFMDMAEKLDFKLIKKTGVSIEQLVENTIETKKNFDFEIVNQITGISLEDPESDVRLMFSREGINLPDLTGKIAEELKKPKINIQFINQQLYDDAIIWPVSITNRGIWARKDLDLSDYNTLKPLGELQWIGRK